MTDTIPDDAPQLNQIRVDGEIYEVPAAVARSHKRFEMEFSDRAKRIQAQDAEKKKAEEAFQLEVAKAITAMEDEGSADAVQRYLALEVPRLSEQAATDIAHRVQAYKTQPVEEVRTASLNEILELVSYLEEQRIFDTPIHSALYVWIVSPGYLGRNQLENFEEHLKTVREMSAGEARTHVDRVLSWRLRVVDAPRYAEMIPRVYEHMIGDRIDGDTNLVKLAEELRQERDAQIARYDALLTQTVLLNNPMMELLGLPKQARIEKFIEMQGLSDNPNGADKPKSK